MTITELSIKHGIDSDLSLLIKAQILISLHNLSADFIKALYHIETRQDRQS